MNLEIANRLVALRRERGLSQEDLAARLGVSRQAISKWERAESSPDTDNLIALARLYGISLDELLLQPAQGATAAKASTPMHLRRDRPRRRRRRTSRQRSLPPRGNGTKRSGPGKSSRKRCLKKRSKRFCGC